MADASVRLLDAIQRVAELGREAFDDGLLDKCPEIRAEMQDALKEWTAAGEAVFVALDAHNAQIARNDAIKDALATVDGKL